MEPFGYATVAQDWCEQHASGNCSVLFFFYGDLVSAPYSRFWHAFGGIRLIQRSEVRFDGTGLLATRGAR